MNDLQLRKHTMARYLVDCAIAACVDPRQHKKNDTVSVDPVMIVCKGDIAAHYPALGRPANLAVLELHALLHAYLEKRGTAGSLDMVVPWANPHTLLAYCQQIQQGS